MKRSTLALCAIAFVASVATGCVDYRPIRNGLKDESVYLDKDALLVPPDSRDPGWLLKTTVVEASSPNVVADYAFTGFESELRYVKLRFVEDKLQILDGRKLQVDDPANPNDNLSNSLDAVMGEFTGSHVDIKLRESLDGERTNWMEENTENPWQVRQHFKVDFESLNVDPVSYVAWYYADFLAQCATVSSKNLVPDSFEYDQKNQHLSFLLQVNYDLTVDGGCYDMVSLAHDTGTATINYRLSFYRPAPNDFKAEEIAEKDLVNKKYGAFQVLNTFRHPETGLLSAKSLLQRWNPNRAEPVTFYFGPGFPERFKPMFDVIKEETNKAMEDAGAKLRFRFADYNEGGVERKVGDIRYSFVVWHQDIDTTKGLLGYGPSAVDPRTGEVLSASLNLYNVGMDYYRFIIQDYLEDHGALTLAEHAKAKGLDPATAKWEEITCDADETAKPVNEDRRNNAALFNAMLNVMDIEPSDTTSVRDQLVPKPVRESYMSDLHRVLPEMRYVEPAWNSYVYRTLDNFPVKDFQARLLKDREFNAELHDIMMNENPFGSVAMHTQQGLQAQLDFAKKLREWKKNHEMLKNQLDMLGPAQNIYTATDADIFNALSKGARKCVAGKFESNEQYRERIIEEVVFQVAIHEFGHNLSLRHNFYGSLDAKHMHDDQYSASVMDYVRSQYESAGHRGWGDYDKAALKWIYGDETKRAEVMKDDFLYCTDEHRSRSPLCTAHDIGVTPSQITLNSIEQYDFFYKYRNRRAYRTFWDTSAYIGSVYDSTFSLQRMWYMGIFDWGGGGVQNTLKSLDQVEGKTVLTPQQYDEIASDFHNDVSASIGMTMSFYDAVINQQAGFRNYQTEFDPYYGDVLRLGIIIDKLFATYAFTDLQEVYNYNPNVQTYVSLYDSPFDDKNLALSQRVLDDMLGASYDTYPWFKYTALALFASAANSNLVDRVELKERIAIQRFENQMEFDGAFGPDALAQATSPDNVGQLFEYKGEQYVYTFLPDRAWHLVASKSRSPVSFQFMRDYNKKLNGDADDELDNYGLKILLAYHEYFNNFVGF